LHLGILSIHLGLCLVSPLTATIFEGPLDYSGSLRDHQVFLDWLHNMNVYFYPTYFLKLRKSASLLWNWLDKLTNIGPMW